MKLTFLGTGTSQGVPQIGCRCPVCRSVDPRDRRLRSSVLVQTGEVTIVIDAGPDFRTQMLRAGVRRVDAILLTHEHRDHTAGLDDVRALNFCDYPEVRRVAVYGVKQTLKAVQRDFAYAFAEPRYRGVPEIDLCEVTGPFDICGVDVTPVTGHHAPGMDVTGYRIGKLAYLTDFADIAPSEESKLHGVEVLVVNALRVRPHDSHFSLGQALSLIERVRPQRAYLTHISHEMGLFRDLSLPKGVFLATDELTIQI